MVTDNKGETIYATLDNTLLKSAELEIVDDNGVVIELSQRFNPSNEDIRYSITPIRQSEDSKSRGWAKSTNSAEQTAWNARKMLLKKRKRLTRRKSQGGFGSIRQTKAR